MTQNFSLLRKIPLLLLGLIAFINLFGLQLSMLDVEAGNMSDCIMMSPHDMPANTLCPMSVAEHLLKWQQMFVSLPTMDATSVLVGLLVSIFAGMIVFLFKEVFVDHVRDQYDHYKEHLREVKLFDYLLFFIAGGKLHPRLYT